MLDEPISNVDLVTEAAIYDNVLAALPDARIVAAVHRRHLLPRFDSVVLLEEGRVLDVGRWDALSWRPPSFRAMWAAQHPGQAPRCGSLPRRRRFPGSPCRRGAADRSAHPDRGRVVDSGTVLSRGQCGSGAPLQSWSE